VPGPYNVAPGVYNILVVGYIGSGEAAAGEASNVPVALNAVTNVPTIHLEAPAFTGSDTGTFSWNIHATVTGLTAATMSFTEVTGSGNAPPADVDLFDDNWEDSITDFPVGYYYVDFELTAGGSTRTFRHILHIYKNQTSAFSYTFNNSYFTFTTVNVPIDYIPPAVTPLELVYEETGAGGSPPPASLVEKQTVTVSIGNVGGVPTSVDITVDNDDAYTTIEWYFNSTTALTPSEGVSSGGETLTVDATAAPFTTQGFYQLTVVGIPASGGPSSMIVFISIVP